MCADKRTAGVGAQCYERAVKWLLLVLIACSATKRADPIVDDFRATERTCIAAFNDALEKQRTNAVDELGLAEIVERDVLAPWREMRARVTAAKVPQADAELYAALRSYVETREQAWQEFIAALRSHSDEQARPHYDAYHRKNTEAQDQARVLAGFFKKR
jgi:hypothetical protein